MLFCENVLPYIDETYISDLTETFRQQTCRNQFRAITEHEIRMIP